MATPIMNKPHLILDFESRAPGMLHPAPWHNTMLVLLSKRKLEYREIERRYKIEKGLGLIQPDCTDSARQVLEDLRYDGFVMQDYEGRYCFENSLPFGGRCHSSLQYGAGGLLSFTPYEKPPVGKREMVLHAIRAAGGVMGRRDIMRQVRYVDSALLTAMEGDGLIVAKKEKKKRGHPKTYYEIAKIAIDNP